MIKLCTLCEHPQNIIPTVNVRYCAHCDTAQCRKPTHRCGQCMSAASHQYEWNDTDEAEALALDNVLAEEPEEMPHWQQALGYDPDDHYDDDDDGWDDGYGPIGVS